MVIKFCLFHYSFDKTSNKNKKKGTLPFSLCWIKNSKLFNIILFFFWGICWYKHFFKRNFYHIICCCKKKLPSQLYFSLNWFKSRKHVQILCFIIFFWWKLGLAFQMHARYGNAGNKFKFYGIEVDLKSRICLKNGREFQS